jgi:hypothetical protein
MSNARAHRAAWLAAIVVVALGFGIALVKVFNENLVFFYTPTQILGGEVPTGEKTYRLGGMVEVGSVQREADSLKVRFVVSDLNNKVPVEFRIYSRKAQALSQMANGTAPHSKPLRCWPNTMKTTCRPELSSDRVDIPVQFGLGHRVGLVWCSRWFCRSARGVQPCASSAFVEINSTQCVAGLRAGWYCLFGACLFLRHQRLFSPQRG